MASVQGCDCADCAGAPTAAQAAANVAGFTAYVEQSGMAQVICNDGRDWGRMSVHELKQARMFGTMDDITFVHNGSVEFDAYWSARIAKMQARQW
jgi:hypothetical protein